jgi:hypothetical protein
MKKWLLVSISFLSYLVSADVTVSIDNVIHNEDNSITVDFIMKNGRTVAGYEMSIGVGDNEINAMEDNCICEGNNSGGELPDGCDECYYDYGTDGIATTYEEGYDVRSTNNVCQDWRDNRVYGECRDSDGEVIRFYDEYGVEKGANLYEGYCNSTAGNEDIYIDKFQAIPAGNSGSCSEQTCVWFDPNQGGEIEVPCDKDECLSRGLCSNTIDESGAYDSSGNEIGDGEPDLNTECACLWDDISNVWTTSENYWVPDYVWVSYSTPEICNESGVNNGNNWRRWNRDPNRDDLGEFNAGDYEDDDDSPSGNYVDDPGEAYCYVIGLCTVPDGNLEEVCRPDDSFTSGEVIDLPEDCCDTSQAQAIWENLDGLRAYYNTDPVSGAANGLEQRQQTCEAYGNEWIVLDSKEECEVYGSIWIGTSTGTEENEAYDVGEQYYDTAPGLTPDGITGGILNFPYSFFGQEFYPGTSSSYNENFALTGAGNKIIAFNVALQNLYTPTEDYCFDDNFSDTIDKETYDEIECCNINPLYTPGAGQEEQWLDNWDHETSTCSGATTWENYFEPHCASDNTLDEEACCDDWDGDLGECAGSTTWAADHYKLFSTTLSLYGGVEGEVYSLLGETCRREPGFGCFNDFIFSTAAEVEVISEMIPFIWDFGTGGATASYGDDICTPSIGENIENEEAGVCQSYCGDAVCDSASGELFLSCPIDCESSDGDGVCDWVMDETSESSADCPEFGCGDHVCSEQESNDECSSDCSITCGDGECNTLIDGEGYGNCIADCPMENCGDLYCSDEEGDGDGDGDCPGDCGCGNGVCDQGETYGNCSADCESVCGDGFYHHPGLGEPFEDLDSDGEFTAEVDTYTDLNENGVWDSPGEEQPSEIFTDANGDGQYNDGEEYDDANGNGVWDQNCGGSEPYVDSDGSLGWSSGEDFTDLNGNGEYDSVYGDAGADGLCIDLFCSQSEDYGDCPEDCESICGDGFYHHAGLDGIEDSLGCPADYEEFCGDNYCSGLENHGSCSNDCESTCGDLFYDHIGVGGTEDGDSCPGDYTDTPSDGYCGATENWVSDSINCASNCDDGFCNSAAGEDVENCPGDCSANGCGNGVCAFLNVSAGQEDILETWETCAEDCESRCGDDLCDSYYQETLENCPSDCAVCGDGICTAGEEDYISCLGDCPPVIGCKDDETACNYDNTVDVHDADTCEFLDCAEVCGGDAIEDCSGQCNGEAEVDDEGNCLSIGEFTPIAFSLSDNYPNPFNPVTSIKYSVEKPGYVNISIYNIMGHKVFDLVSGYHSPGVRYSAAWNSNTQSNIPVSTGIYFYEMRSGDYVERKKMVLVK